MSKPTIQKEFKRMEIKYIIDRATFKALQEELQVHLVADQYAHSIISNVYFDSEDYQLIKDSLNHRHGSEKIRMRTYDPKPNKHSQVFLEIKKKDLIGEEEVGRKFRLTSNPISIYNYVKHGLADSTISEEKVGQELSLLRERYQELLPKMYIHYRRYSMKGIEDPKIRVTFDRDIRYRDYDVNLSSDHHGQPLLDDDKMIMEVKVKNGLPAWMEEIFDRFNLVSQPFSKYANAYLKANDLVPELVREEATSIA